MKRVIHTIFAVTMLLAATLTASAQSEQNRSVSGFNSVGSAGPFTVHIKIDGTESLKITGKQEALDKILTVVEDGKLEIKFKHREDENNYDGDHWGDINVYITAKSLSSLANAGSGNMTVQGALSGQRVEISLAGSGDITSAVKSGYFKANIAGSGSIQTKGSADEVKVSIAGSGSMNGKGLKVESASVNIAGSGNAYFAADKSIEAHIAGSGGVVYSGNATVSSHTIGSGSVSKED